MNLRSRWLELYGYATDICTEKCKEEMMQQLMFKTDVSHQLSLHSLATINPMVRDYLSLTYSNQNIIIPWKIPWVSFLPVSVAYTKFEKK